MRLITVNEAAEQIKQHPASIRRKIRQGEIAAYRLGSGPRAPIRLDAEELGRYLGAALCSSPPFRASAATGGPQTRREGDVGR